MEEAAVTITRVEPAVADYGEFCLIGHGVSLTEARIRFREMTRYRQKHMTKNHGIVFVGRTRYVYKSVIDGFIFQWQRKGYKPLIDWKGVTVAP